MRMTELFYGSVQRIHTIFFGGTELCVPAAAGTELQMPKTSPTSAPADKFHPGLRQPVGGNPPQPAAQQPALGLQDC